MQILISQPQERADQSASRLEKEKVICALKAYGHIIFDEATYEELSPKDAKPLLWRLGRRIQLMARADAVYFMDGWENDRDCRLEYEVATAFRLTIINAEWRELSNSFSVAQTLAECFPEEFFRDKNESVSATTNRIIRLCKELIGSNRAYWRRHKQLKIRRRIR